MTSLKGSGINTMGWMHVSDKHTLVVAHLCKASRDSWLLHWNNWEIHRLNHGVTNGCGIIINNNRGIWYP